MLVCVKMYIFNVYNMTNYVNIIRSLWMIPIMRKEDYRRTIRCLNFLNLVIYLNNISR